MKDQHLPAPLTRSQPAAATDAVGLSRLGPEIGVGTDTGHTLQARVDRSARMLAQRRCIQLAFGPAVAQPPVIGTWTPDAAVLQRRTGGKAEGQKTGDLVSEWTGKDDEEQYQLTTVKDPGEWTRVWRLEVYHKKVYKGHIFIYFKGEVLKPDGLEVPRDAQGFAFGSKLGAAAVRAMTSEPIKTQTASANSIQLNLVNPLSAHISLKELTLTLNGADMKDAAAEQAGTLAVNNPTVLAKGKLYDPATFSNFWGRLVYLVLNNQVTVECSGFGVNGYLNAGTIAQVAPRTLVESMVKAKAGIGFTMNITAPKPP